jgi:hypothetical protein
VADVVGVSVGLITVEGGSGCEAILSISGCMFCVAGASGADGVFCGGVILIGCMFAGWLGITPLSIFLLAPARTKVKIIPNSAIPPTAPPII